MMLVHKIVIFLIDLPAWQSVPIVALSGALFVIFANALCALWEIRERKQQIIEHREWYREFRKTDAFKKARDIRRRSRARRAA